MARIRDLLTEEQLRILQPDIDSQGPRLFVLIRRTDVSGVSGVGLVAEGVVFTDGRVAMRWLSDTPTTSLYDDIDHVAKIHGHGGSTELRYLDEIDQED